MQPLAYYPLQDPLPLPRPRVSLLQVARQLQAQGRPGFPRRYTGSLDCAVQMLRQEGPASFWRGSVSTALKIVPSIAATRWVAWLAALGAWRLECTAAWAPALAAGFKGAWEASSCKHGRWGAIAGSGMGGAGGGSLLSWCTCFPLNAAPWLLAAQAAVRDDLGTAGSRRRTALPAGL